MNATKRGGKVGIECLQGSSAAAVISPAESGWRVWIFQKATLHTELHSESRASN